MPKKRSQSIMGGFDFQRIDPYGSQVDGEVQTELMYIESLLPDPLQPRALLPPDLDEALLSGEKRPGEVLKIWLARAESPEAAPAQRQAMEGLRQLAATIQFKGLINPITVRDPLPEDRPLPAGVNHVIVTGERRWWAHVLLSLENRLIEEEDHPDQIRATLVPARNVRALQLIENIAREDLSVIEKAHGLISLRDELSVGQEKKVYWKDVEALLRMSRSYRTRLLKVLRLSEEAQAIVSRHNLPEKTIRPVTEHLLDKPALQVQVLNQLVAWQQAEDESGGSRRIAAYVGRLLAQDSSQDSPQSIAQSGPSHWLSRFQNNVRKTLTVFDHLEKEELDNTFIHMAAGNAETVAQLQQLRQKIDTILMTAQEISSEER